MKTAPRTRVSALLATLALILAAWPGAALADDETATHYYLAMGDSLAQGWQPDAPSQPHYKPDGYVPQVYAALSADDPKLSLDNSSCGGESTVSMIDGSQPRRAAASCGSPELYRFWYPHKTQLAEAVNFLAAHKGKVALVTIDIGGNDLAFCVFRADDTAGALSNVYTTVAANLDTILTELHSAGRMPPSWE